MIDDRTPYLDLPLPHPDNLLSEDVLRLRQAVVSLDTGFQEQAALVAESLRTHTALVSASLTQIDNAVTSSLSAQQAAIDIQLRDMQALIYASL